MTPSSQKDPYGHLTTEQPNPESQRLHRLSTLEFLDLMQEEETKVLDALNELRETLAE